MGVVQELSDIVGHFLKCYEIVYQFQQGLYVDCGRVVERRKNHMEPEEKRRVEEAERGLVDALGYKSFLPFMRPKLPDEFRQSALTGLPVHKERYSKILQPGIYLYFPLTGHLEKESVQERVLNLGNITVPTHDEQMHAMLVSCNLRYHVEDFYLAYTKVHDFEASLKDHTLSILAKHSRGKRYEEWSEPEVVRSLEKDVLAEVRETGREWGLDIQAIYVTDNVPSTIQRLTHDGVPVVVQTVPQGR